MNRHVTKSSHPASQGFRIEGAARERCIVMLVFATFLLGACDTTNYAAKEEAKTPAAPAAPTAIVRGSKLTLRVPLNFPPSGAPLMFQRNAIVTPAQLAGNAPFCRFTPASSAVSRSLKPTTFTVRNIDYDERRSASGPRPVSVTHYRLALDPKQPGYVLSCEWPEGAPSGAFVTADDVEATVSAFFTIDAVH